MLVCWLVRSGIVAVTTVSGLISKAFSVGLLMGGGGGGAKAIGSAAAIILSRIKD